MSELEKPTPAAVPQRRPFPFKLLGALVVAIAAAGALAYYAWTLRTDHLALQGDLKAAKVTANQFAACDQAKTAALGTLDTCKTERGKLEAQQKELGGNLEATKAELESLRKQRAETAQRLAAFRDLTSKFQKMIDSGRVNVVVRGGRMIVKLPANVLFDSGSAALSRDGELALMEVAVVLRQFKDRRFVVEGHTDNRPLESSATAKYRNNWELSTARAVTVTEFLIEAKMDPKNLVAAGHAEFDPVGDNKTAKGRQENRRIEIILQPDIKELPALPSAGGSGKGATDATKPPAGDNKK